MSSKAGLLLLLIMGLILLPSTGSASRASRLADAIASAEGYFVAGSRSQRNNNPGDLTDSLGYPTTGYDGPFAIFQTPEDGWRALIHQVRMMLDGSSAYYDPSMSIQEMANVYTATEREAWAQNVAAHLGVAVSTPIGQV